MLGYLSYNYDDDEIAFMVSSGGWEWRCPMSNEFDAVSGCLGEWVMGK